MSSSRITGFDYRNALASKVDVCWLLLAFVDAVLAELRASISKSSSKALP